MSSSLFKELGEKDVLSANFPHSTYVQTYEYYTYMTLHTDYYVHYITYSVIALYVYRMMPEMVDLYIMYI